MIVSHLSFRYPQILLLFFAVEYRSTGRNETKERTFYDTLPSTLLFLLYVLVENCLMAYYIVLNRDGVNIMLKGKLMVRNYRHSQTILNHRLMGIINCCWMGFYWLSLKGGRWKTPKNRRRYSQIFQSVNGYHLSVRKLAVPCALMVPEGRSNVTLGNGST